MQPTTIRLAYETMLVILGRRNKDHGTRAASRYPGTLLIAFIFFFKQARTISDELKRELKEEIMSVRSEVSSIQEEVHDMNGRLGRVEGLLMAFDIERPRQK